MEVMKFQKVLIRFLKLIIPSLLMQIIRYWRGSGIGFTNYYNYKSALVACGSTNYSDMELVNTILEKCNDFNTQIKIQNIRSVDASIAVMYHLLNSIQTNSKNIHFIDLGGGGGHALSIIKNLNLSLFKNLKCTVVETEGMVNRAKELSNNFDLSF